MSTTSSTPRVPPVSPILPRPVAAQADLLWTDEGVSGVCHNQLTGQLAHRVARAFATHIIEHNQDARRTILVAGDGRPLTVELVAATAESIQWCGCDVIELSDASSGGLTLAIHKFQAHGGVLIGNGPSESHTASLTFFAAGGKPLSCDGCLGQIKTRSDRGHARPVRSAGNLTRGSIDAEYGAAFQNYLGFQRISRIVIDSASGPLMRWLKQLLPAGCQLIRPQTYPMVAASSAKPSKPGPTFRQHREKMIARQIIADAAEFGIWIDGNGEACTVIDDRGLPIAPQTLVTLLAKCPTDESDEIVTFVENKTRESTYLQLSAGNTTLATDSQGRIWHRTADGAYQLDALYVLARLFAMLKLTGRPLRKLLG